MEKFPAGPKHDRSKESDTPKDAESLEREPKVKILSIGYDDEYRKHSHDHLFQVTQDFDLEKLQEQFYAEAKAKRDLYSHHASKALDATVNKGDHDYWEREVKQKGLELDDRDVFPDGDNKDLFPKWLMKKGIARKVDVTMWDGLDPKKAEEPIDWEEWDKFVDAKSHKEYHEYMEAKDTDNGKRPKIRILSMGYNDEYSHIGNTYSPDHLIQIPQNLDIEKTHKQFEEDDEREPAFFSKHDDIEAFQDWLIKKGMAKEVNIVEWDGF